jgi:hypothetical protein
MRSQYINVNEQSSVGPANYVLENTIGRDHVTDSKMQTQPHFSFGKSLTFRTVQNLNKIEGSHG